MTSRERAIELFIKWDTKYKKMSIKKRTKRYFLRKKHNKILVRLLMEEIRKEIDKEIIEKMKEIARTKL